MYSASQFQSFPAGLALPTHKRGRPYAHQDVLELHEAPFSELLAPLIWSVHPRDVSQPFEALQELIHRLLAYARTLGKDARAHAIGTTILQHGHMRKPHFVKTGGGVTVKASSAETSDLSAVWEGQIEPGMLGAAPHYHRGRDELLYVLNGPP